MRRAVMRARRQVLLSVLVAALLLGVPAAVPPLAGVPPATAQTTVSPGDLFVVDFECCGGTGGVIRVDPAQPATSNQTIVSSGQSFVSPAGIALVPSGNLFVVDLD